MNTTSAFGCTKEEFDKLYIETEEFNSDYYKNCKVSKGSFEKFLVKGSKGLSKNKKLTKYL